MEQNDILENFLYNIFTFLIGREPKSSIETHIFRKHNNKLEKSGDLSLPLNLSGWVKYVNNSTANSIKIIDYIERFNRNQLTDFSELLNESKKWSTLHINNVQIYKNKLNLFLNRSHSFKQVVISILQEKENYGCSKLKIKSIEIKIEDDNCSDLTALRLNLIKNVTVNILKISEYIVISNESKENKSNEIVYFTNKSESKHIGKKIVCGVVISNKFGKKNTNISVEEFYKKRTVDMQLMAQHKYGLRVTTEPGWSEFFERLGNAAVIIDLLHVKPSRPVIVNEDSSASTCSKGASFILYNCARLAEIFKKFDKRVTTGEIPPLPDINDVDFDLLNQSEEWELLYVYLMQYPSTVKSCVADILDCRLNTHNLCVFLDALCSTFSVYYRRVRVLTEPRPHLFPVMHARIYLLQAIQQVLHNALALLDIPPIKQM